tara:strand:+ start:704 stop:871 length:168 start_codon:yes stop_codon:yes gene_type:complete
MIEFDKEAYKKLIKEIADGPEEALEIKTIILSYIIYSNENEVNELSEYTDQLSRL